MPTRAQARERLLRTADDMGRRLARNGRPFPSESPAYVTQRVALAAGLPPLPGGAWFRGVSRDVYATLHAAYDRAARP